MDRTPPIDVRRKLRREVGFGCPVLNCGSPYLEWHHFDPPWSESKHHNPDGMIALCAEHHAKAGAGAFTRVQLRNLKEEGIRRAQQVKGRFDWMRYDLLGVIGGNFHHKTLNILRVQGKKVIWFNRDEDGYLLLNIWMPTTTGQPRIQIEDNFWLVYNPSGLVDLVCPPSGKLLKVKYCNGDMMKIEFFELHSLEEMLKKYPEVLQHHQVLSAIKRCVAFPITAVEVAIIVTGMNINVSPSYAKYGRVSVRNTFFGEAAVDIDII